MKLRKSCIFKNTMFHISENLSKTSVFFDIETTGLSWRTSHLYMIGCAYYENNPADLFSDSENADTGGWVLQQWFLEKPSEEKELLEQFSVFLHEHEWDTLVHYNGTTFDIPYLQHKYQFYKLSDPLSCLKTTADGGMWSAPSCKSRDLYQEIRQYKKLLETDSLKQQDLEKYFNLPREDRFSGRELISVYQEYLRSDVENLLHALWMHNYEDVQNLLPICSGINAYHALFEGRFQITAVTFPSHPDNSCGTADSYNAVLGNPEHALTVAFSLSHSLPAAFQTTGAYCTLMAEKSSAVLTIPVYVGELRHYFKDYKNYYYLPDEDMAIHKSVGAFVDPAHRKKATADTCYQRTEGTFLPQMEDHFTPALYMGRKDRISWFDYRKLMLCKDESVIRSYVLSFLEALLRKHDL